MLTSGVVDSILGEIHQAGCQTACQSVVQDQIQASPCRTSSTMNRLTGYRSVPEPGHSFGGNRGHRGCRPRTQQPPTQDPRLEDAGRSIERAPTIALTSPVLQRPVESGLFPTQFEITSHLSPAQPESHSPTGNQAVGQVKESTQLGADPLPRFGSVRISPR
jgi:hypothetical protein